MKTHITYDGEMFVVRTGCSESSGLNVIRCDSENLSVAIEKTREKCEWARNKSWMFCMQHLYKNSRETMGEWGYWASIRNISLRRRSRSEVRGIPYGDKNARTWADATNQIASGLRQRAKHGADHWARWANSTASNQRRRMDARGEAYSAQADEVN